MLRTLLQLITFVTATTSWAHVPGVFVGPFNEGVAYKPLTPSEREDLRQYAESAKARLTEAQQLASGKGYGEESRIYLKAISEVVLASFEQKQRQELLMRMALNEALELTYGIPSEHHPQSRVGGVLASVSRTDSVKATILRDSVALALQFASDDLKATDSGTFADLPYLKFGLQRLMLARGWSTGLNPAYQYRFLRTVLREWLATMTHQGQQRRDKVATQLLRIESAITRPLPLDQAGLASETRFLRRQLTALVKELTKLDPTVTATQRLWQWPRLSNGPSSRGGKDLPPCKRNIDPPKDWECRTSSNEIFVRTKDNFTSELGWYSRATGIMWFDKTTTVTTGELHEGFDPEAFCAEKRTLVEQKLPGMSYELGSIFTPKYLDGISEIWDLDGYPILTGIKVHHLRDATAYDMPSRSLWTVKSYGNRAFKVMCIGFGGIKK